ncbi:MAG: 4-(cytidine 5'-diphospho)-2-C-methyl-D-erythritol kinase [Hyphomonadaceae bacterium]|nr:4-(cytidine 5'-diphospho)-2-C-methyl-D-erythritol kinase [Hyphomonadaceae bacterium]
MRPHSRLVERAPAKLNLHLHVGLPLRDGRHPLESLVAFADIGDEIVVEPANDLSLAIDGPFAEALKDEADNLVLRAARLLGARGAAIRLTKNLPVASGIGGGSADAAATLRALNKLWDLQLSLVELAEKGAALGADIPACVHARACWMSGTGEETAPVSLPGLSAVLVNPLVPAPTGAVYRTFDAMHLGASFARIAPPAWESAASAIQGLTALENDLTAPAIAIAPAVAEVITVLSADPRARLVRMSGSGATVFALTWDRADADAVAASLADRPWWVRAATLAG